MQKLYDSFCNYDDNNYEDYLQSNLLVDGPEAKESFCLNNADAFSEYEYLVNEEGNFNQGDNNE